MNRALLLGLIGLATLAPSALATPVCTDGYMGGPPASQCGGRIFPEAKDARAYVQYKADPFGFSEFQHGIEYLAKKYPRWVSVTTLAKLYNDKTAVSMGADGIRAGEPGDTGDGLDIYVIKLTDHEVADKGKETLFFSLSVHGNERGGLEGGLRTAEDLAVAAGSGGKIVDGIDNYTSTTGKKAEFHSHEVKDVLRREAVYFVDFNMDGWAVGDIWATPPLPYTRGNDAGVDLNRQMPTIGRINEDRNPLSENEMRFGKRLMDDVAKAGIKGKMAYGADIHGELTSQAYMDVMYPAGQFDSVKHRQLMAIAERTKSVIDATLYDGIIDQIEDADGGNEQEGTLKAVGIPTKPAHWGTVWDTLGYTDTGFIGDYLAADVGVTGMDYEIAFNHTVPDKVWNVYLQENHINASRGIIKTAMAYALTQAQDFNRRNVRIDPVGRAGYVVDPELVTDRDGVGTKPGPNADGVGEDGKPVEQRPYAATNQRWFRDTSRLMGRKPFVAVRAADIARSTKALDVVDTLVLADKALPKDPRGRDVSQEKYFSNLRAWVERGGNLVLTDRAVRAVEDLGVLKAESGVRDIRVYQPYANIEAFDHPIVAGLRPNARQLVEAAVLGYGIGNDQSPMTVVTTEAWNEAGGVTVATTGDAAGSIDDGTQTSVGEIKVGEGKVRIVGGALPTPTEANDHRYGLRDYAMTYSGLFIMENAIKHDVPGLGKAQRKRR